MKLEDIKQIVEAHSQKDANEAIEKGFKLQRIMQSKVKTDSIEQMRPVYVLGR
jgi:hypothetical protein